MNCCTNSFPHPRSLASLIFFVSILALPIVAQTRSDADPYQKISFKTERPCVVGTTGEVTSLVKNGVELSVNEDWDCDGVPDAYDNCVGMANREQFDSDGNGTGDVCEAATTIKADMRANRSSNTKSRSRKAARAKSRSNTKVKGRNARSNTKAKSRKTKAADKHSRSGVRKRRSR